MSTERRFLKVTNMTGRPPDTSNRGESVSGRGVVRPQGDLNDGSPAGRRKPEPGSKEGILQLAAAGTLFKVTSITALPPAAAGPRICPRESSQPLSAAGLPLKVTKMNDKPPRDGFYV